MEDKPDRRVLPGGEIGEEKGAERAERSKQAGRGKLAGEIGLSKGKRKEKKGKICWAGLKARERERFCIFF